MACVNCAKIRTALLHGKMADAMGLTVEALREKIGWTAPGQAKPMVVGEAGPEIITQHLDDSAETHDEPDAPIELTHDQIVEPEPIAG